ncbi:hypothetical protein N658DRAFT_423969 [Parathielavia hyrcaniae]|uniref:Zn(2)-C6 fungal-type domain-containing protein n=1 Tax=Parathielavia hyrcaniae TaxID=113614 RepID=A0AAN6Q285_9PEZI|nr:hypothetical protein N658DRAFT_423969 [Parathielavia hyrcaniae]
MDSLPTPPNEEHVKPHGLKRPHATSKSVKTAHRTLKRTSTHAHPPSPTRDSHSQHSSDGRHKRVWKACERCRMKKTKCDGEFPCKRCKDDGLICTAGTRKKTEYKQIPPGYAEVLENTQFVLVATVQKLYSMVRNGERWELGEPELNDRGQPIIHNVAAKLGCLRPNCDLDLPAHSIFPEDEAGMAELARQLQDQVTAASPPPPQTITSLPSQSKRSRQQHGSKHAHNFYSHHHPTECASSTAPSDGEHSDLDLDTDYRRAAFCAASTVSLSPASLSYPDFDVSPPSAVSSDGFPPLPLPSTTTASQSQSPTLSTHPSNGNTNSNSNDNNRDIQWAAATSRPMSMEFHHHHHQSQSQQSQQQQQMWMAAAAAGQGFMDASDVLGGGSGMYGLKPAPHGAFSSSRRDPNVMMGVGDPMIFSSGYDEDPLRPLFSSAIL